MVYRLRPATVADLEPIVRLLADDQLGAARDGGFTDDPEPYRRAFAVIDADPAHLLLAVLAPDGAVVGTLQLSFLPGLARRGALRAQLEAVRVAGAHRGGGLGTAMLTWAVDVARQRGCSLVQLTSDKSRVDAHRWYARLGFVASHDGFKLRL